eukprot:gene11093-biopygen10882
MCHIEEGTCHIEEGTCHIEEGTCHRVRCFSHQTPPARRSPAAEGEKRPASGPCPLSFLPNNRAAGWPYCPVLCCAVPWQESAPVCGWPEARSVLLCVSNAARAYFARHLFDLSCVDVPIYRVFWETISKHGNIRREVGHFGGKRGDFLNSFIIPPRRHMNAYLKRHCNGLRRECGSRPRCGALAASVAAAAAARARTGGGAENAGAVTDRSVDVPRVWGMIFPGSFVMSAS